MPQLSISFQSGTSLDAAVSTSRPVYPVWPWLSGATKRCLTSWGIEKNSASIAVRGVEQILGQIVAGVDEPGRQAAAHAVDDRGALRRGAPLEREQVDIENVIHRASVARAHSRW